MKPWLIGLLVAACGGSSPAKTPTSPPPATASSQDQGMLELMDRFVRDPFGADPDDPKRILQFVLESKAVQVVLDERATPWTIDEKIDEPSRHRLLTAYLAGNAGAQLRSGRKGDDIHAGIAATLKVYAIAKARQPGLVSTHLDHLVALEAKGELKAHLDRIAAAREKK